MSNNLGSVAHAKNAEPNHEIPGDLQAALIRNTEALSQFVNLPRSHQREYIEWIKSAKRKATRESRIQKAITMISDDKRTK